MALRDSATLDCLVWHSHAQCFLLSLLWRSGLDLPSVPLPTPVHHTLGCSLRHVYSSKLGIEFLRSRAKWSPSPSMFFALLCKRSLSFLCLIVFVVLAQMIIMDLLCVLPCTGASSPTGVPSRGSEVASTIVQKTDFPLGAAPIFLELLIFQPEKLLLVVIYRT